MLIAYFLPAFTLKKLTLQRLGVQVFMLPADAILEEATLGKIISSGHSRVPIYHPDNRYVVDSLLLRFKVLCSLVQTL